MSQRDYRRGPMRTFKPYVAGKPAKEVQRELGIEGPVVKLASNENPLGPSPKAVEAIRAVLDKLHLYPFDDAWYFRRAVAEHHGVSPAEVFAAAGSVELLELCGTCFLEPGDEVLTSERTFAIYALLTQKAGATLVLAPCKDGYAYDLEAMADRITPATKIIFLANPTNPTGTWFTATEFDAFMARVPDDVLVVYDEAYTPYVTADDMPDGLAWFRTGRDVLVLRTLSKAHGLAGIRVGYGIGPERIISALNQGRTAFNVSIPAQVGGMAALEDHAFLARSRAHNTEERERMRRELDALDVTVPPSQTNFLLVDTRLDAARLFMELQKLGVVVRPMGGYGMPGAVRVSIGTREENDRFLRAFRSLVG